MNGPVGSKSAGHEFWVSSLVINWEKNYVYNRLRAVSLFSVVRRAKRETHKWPRAWLMARDGRGCRPRFARLAASPLPRACIALTKSEEKETARSLRLQLHTYWSFIKIKMEGRATSSIFLKRIYSLRVHVSIKNVQLVSRDWRFTIP